MSPFLICPTNSSSPRVLPRAHQATTINQTQPPPLAAGRPQSLDPNSTLSPTFPSRRSDPLQSGRSILLPPVPWFSPNLVAQLVPAPAMDLLDSLAAQDRWLYPAFLAMYATIYCAGHALFRRWPLGQRLDGASCLISLFHGTPAALAAAGAIFALAPESRTFAAPNSRLQGHILDYSVAYFTMDLLHYLVFLPGDVLFIAHHLATLFVFLTCRYLVLHGAYALLVLLVLAEVTSLLQNVWTLAGIWREQSPSAARVYGALSPPFYVLYTIVRGVAGPLFLLKMSVFYLSGQAVDVIPWWVRISWIAVVGTAIAVSNLWIWNLWKALFRERKQAMAQKDT